jgi:hypothetical protein
MKSKIASGFLVLLSFAFIACGGSEPSPQIPVKADEPGAQVPVQEAVAQAPTRTGITKISEYSDLWNELYTQNEAVINRYEGMPIMGLVTPPTTFVTTIQYDLLNLENQDGRFEGKLMMAGYPGFVEKTASRISFGYDHTLEKDGFGPSAKAGDHSVQKGFLDLETGHYRSETQTDRAGKLISRAYTEFKRCEDNSMICIDFKGNAFDMRGNPSNSDQVIFLHNAPGRYDFVVAKGTAGTDFVPFSFAEKGNIGKEQALELIKAAGYTIDKSGGIKDGVLTLDT